MNMADRIQHLRKIKGISQEELADKVGVSRQAVSKWESEQSTPDIEKVILLSNFFDVTTDYLLKGIEPITENGTERSDARIFSLIGSVFNWLSSSHYDLEQRANLKFCCSWTNFNGCRNYGIRNRTVYR